jgi:hypothetical protein
MTQRNRHLYDDPGQRVRFLRLFVAPHYDLSPHHPTDPIQPAA